MNTENLWQHDKFTKFPNELIGYLCHSPGTSAETKILLLIARVSLGFKGGKKTIQRFNLGNFAQELGFDTSTACRVINKLIKKKRIFRSSPQGEYFFYSLYPFDATPDAFEAEKNATDAKKHSVNGMSPKSDIAPMQRLQNTNRSPNLSKEQLPANKDLNKNIKEKDKEIGTGSLLTFLEAKASPALSKKPRLIKGICNETICALYKQGGMQGLKEKLRECGISSYALDNLQEDQVQTLGNL